MQNANEIYQPFDMTYLFALLTLIFILMLVVIKFFGGKLLKIISLKKAKKELEELSKQRPSLANETLQKIDQIEKLYAQQQISPSEAAESLSNTVRLGYDKLMNHKTIAQSKNEIANRNLARLFSLLDITYPTEFNSSDKTINLEPSCFNLSREIIKSCI